MAEEVQTDQQNQTTQKRNNNYKKRYNNNNNYDNNYYNDQQNNDYYYDYYSGNTNSNYNNSNKNYNNQRGYYKGGKSNYDKSNNNYYDNYQVKDTKEDKIDKKAGRIKISDLKLEDVIPPRPTKKEIIKEPTEKAHNEKIDAFMKEIDDLHAKKNDLVAEINLVKSGITDEETKAINDRINEINKIFENKSKESKELYKTVGEIKNIINDKKDERDILKKELEFFNLKKLDDEIVKIQEKIGFGKLTATEEKKLIDRKRVLENQRPKVKLFMVLSEEIKEISTKHQDDFNQNNVLYKETGKLYKERDALYKKKKEKIESNQKSIEVKVPILEEKIKEINALISSKIQERKKYIQEYNESWTKYEDQQALLSYIERAEKQKDYLKKQLKKKQEEEKRLKEEEKKKAIEVEKQEDIPFIWEISTINWLITHFKAPFSKQQGDQKIEENKKEVKGKDNKLKPIDLSVREKQDTIAISNPNEKKKEKKVKGQNKREIENENEFLDIDLNILTSIQEIKLSPPVLKSEVEGFLKDLEQKLIYFKNLSDQEKKKKKETKVKTQDYDDKGYY